MVPGFVYRRLMMAEDEEMVSISKARLAELEAAEDKLNRLEAAGVDNWEGYEYAMGEEDK